MRRRRRPGSRDQDFSAFNPALAQLCRAVSATGAALVDSEGETVDYAGALDAFDIRIAAAEWAIVLSRLRRSRFAFLSETAEMFARGATSTFAIFAIDDGYALVIQLPRRAFSVSRRAVGAALRELCFEANLQIPDAFLSDREHWRHVRVKSEGAPLRRPKTIFIEGEWQSVEVLGRWISTRGDGEAGYRVRVASGAEVTLVREPRDRWYVDSPIR